MEIPNQLLAYILPIIIGIIAFWIYSTILVGKSKFKNFLAHLRENIDNVLLLCLGFLTAGEIISSFIGYGSQFALDTILLVFISAISIFVLTADFKVSHFYHENKEAIIDLLKIVPDLKPNTGSLIQYHSCISGKGIVDYRNEITKQFIENLKSLCDNKHTLPLTIIDGHKWSVKLLTDLKEENGDYVRAVSLLNYKEGEWNQNLVTTWEHYVEANKTAANSCKDVRRIFVTKKDDLIEYLKTEHDTEKNEENPVYPYMKELIEAHTPPKYHKNGNEYEFTKSPTITGIFVEKKLCDKLFTLGGVNLNEGFILIKKNNVKMAVIDKFTTNTQLEKMYNVEINYNINDIDKLEKAFATVAYNAEIIKYFNGDMKECPPKLLYDINKLGNCN